MSGADFSRESLEGLAGLISFLEGAWHDFGYETPPTPDCKPIPPLGDRSAAAIKAGHEAIEAIDELTRQLYTLREQLVGELRQDSDIRGARVDAMLAAEPSKPTVAERARDGAGRSGFEPVARLQRVPACLVCGVRPVAAPDVVVCADCDQTGADPAAAR